MKTPFVIAILGAESTGKTQLAQALATGLRDSPALRVTWVPEWLRAWCDRQRRTPQAHEQLAIAREQTRLIEEACTSHDVVVCDTTAVMTAVYSQLLFNDRSLDGLAVRAHRRVDLTLLTALDLPWQADGHQRDGPHVREPVDAAIRELLHANQLDWSAVCGTGPLRAASAVQVVKAAWGRRPHAFS